MGRCEMCEKTRFDHKKGEQNTFIIASYVCLLTRRCNISFHFKSFVGSLVGALACEHIARFIRRKYCVFFTVKFTVWSLIKQSVTMRSRRKNFRIAARNRCKGWKTKSWREVKMFISLLMPSSWQSEEVEKFMHTKRLRTTNLHFHIIA